MLQSPIETAQPAGPRAVPAIQGGQVTAIGRLQPGVADVRSYGATGNGVADDTAAIQAAINQHGKVYIPAGVYRIDPKIGLVVRTGTEIIGDGRTRTILLAGTGGATMKELASYAGGSLIRRSFDPGGKNDYVTYVRLADFTVLLTHPADSVTENAIQIGIDLRNISRSLVERVHVGNMPPLGAPITRAYDRRFYSQGFGIVLGSVSSSTRSYAGGEVNTVRDSSVWGAYKLIVQDDAQLSPRSAAHAVLIEACDLQGGHVLLSQESRYTRGVSWRDNVLQNVIPRPGSREASAVLRMEGSNNLIDGGYIEASGSADYLLQLGSISSNNMIRLPYASTTNRAKVEDLGSGNSINLKGPDFP
ncbi:hypothetical protein E5A73_18425 [Sphingomonas gei]|uniref:Rhamnogalacturonase A/B/Epimerase-like pectate lyase domain-containing protein n=2 Tax=Sphingomonas gei TaxID=1395960 RepID=A0A4S1X653_9SPHN|nr:hypothetical protein E5A73_18425 [Sphingomonas gei]